MQKTKQPFFFFTIIHRDKPKYKGFQLGLPFSLFIEVKRCPEWRFWFSVFRLHDSVQIYSKIGLSIWFRWFTRKTNS